MRNIFISLLLASALAGCDGGTGEDDAGRVAVDAGGNDTDAGGNDTDAGGNDTDAGGNDTDAGGGGTVTLTVNNILAWCDVSVNGGAASAASTQTVEVPAGTVVPLMATARTGFIWDYGWDGTDNDPGTGADQHDTMMNTQVTVNADAVVRVCCPFPDGSGCD
jgi:hypothetical protein